MISDDTVLSVKNVEYIAGKYHHEELEYLEATGEQYIDTLVTPTNNFRIISKVSPTAVFDTILSNGHNYCGIFYGSAYPNAQDNSMEFYLWSNDPNSSINGTGLIANYGNETFQGSIPVYTGDILVSDFNRNQMTVFRDSDIVYSHTFTQSFFTSSRTLNLFSLHRQNNYYGGSKIYYVKIYDNDKLIRDFIPVLKNGTPAMYDKENGRYYYNSGTGTFIYEPKIFIDEQNKPANLATVARFFDYDKKNLYLDKPLSVSDLKYFCNKNSTNQNPYYGYTQLEYIEADGHQYIDTKFYPNQDTRIELHCDIESQETSPLFGARTSIDGNQSFCLWLFNGSYRFDYQAQQHSFGGITITGRRFIDANGYNRSFIVDQKQWNIGNYTFSVPNPLYIFGMMENEGLDNRHPSGKIYLCNIFSGSGTDHMERRFIPAKRNSDGVSGLLDILDCSFYESLGEPWIPGPEIGPIPDFTLSGYDFVEYAASSTETYVDTEFFPNQDSRVTMEMQKVANSSNVSQYIFCARYNTMPAYGAMKSGTDSRWRDDYARESVFLTNGETGASLTQRMIIDKNKNVTYIGHGTVNHVYTNFTTPNTMALYGCFENGGSMNWDIDISLYWCRIYDNGILTRNYYPVKRQTDNAIGLYDFVNERFTLPIKGTLTAGSVIPIGKSKEVL